jgi:integrase
LSAAEVKLLVKAARDTELPDNQNKHTRIYLPEFIILGFQTMMRPSEMLGLEWDRVDFKNKEIELRVADTKGKQRRLVAINPEAEAALLRLRRVCDENFPDARWVFTHTKPRYFGKRIKSVSKVFQLAVERAGIDHATPHALRHSSVTEAVHVGDGTNVVDISKFAGHKDLKTTMRYAHTSGERLHQVVNGLPSVV